MSEKVAQLLASQRALIVGIINLTPDSFSDGNAKATVADYLRQADRLMAEGADILDVGGESTRPGAAHVSTELEYGRVFPFIQAFRHQHADFPLSLDTRNFEVAKKLMAAGIDILNDVSCLADIRFAHLSSQYDSHYILMHTRGTPQNMMTLSQYPEGVVATILKELRARIEVFLAAGGHRKNLILDPGFGFAKSPEQCREMIKQIQAWQVLELPLMLGISRKRFLQFYTGDNLPSERDEISAKLAIRACQAGFRLIRTHHVALTKSALLSLC